LDGESRYRLPQPFLVRVPAPDEEAPAQFLERLLLRTERSRLLRRELDQLGLRAKLLQGIDKLVSTGQPKPLLTVDVFPEWRDLVLGWVCEGDQGRSMGRHPIELAK